MFLHLYLIVQFIKLQNQVLGTLDVYPNVMNSKLSSKDGNLHKIKPVIYTFSEGLLWFAVTGIIEANCVLFCLPLKGYSKSKNNKSGKTKN